MRKIKGKLELKRELIRNLTTRELKRVEGGISQPTCGDNCTTSYTEPGDLRTCVCTDP